MFRQIFRRFKELRPPVKSLIFLFWIYSFTGAILGVFTQIFIFERFTSVSLNIIATLFFYTGIMVGFVVFGYIASVRQLNIKRGFPLSFLLIAISIFFLLISNTIAMAYIAMTLRGIGEGLFWLTVHTFELSETHDEERDFYSSLLSAGGQLLSLVGPAFATFLIFVSGKVLHTGTFTLLFIFTPLIYLLGFFCFSGIRDYRPARVELADLKYFLTEKKNRIAQLYLLGTSFGHFFTATIPPLTVLFILGSALRVGVYNTAFAILSVVAVLILASYRTSGNRLYILGIGTMLLVFMTVAFGYTFTFTALIFFTIAQAILLPILRVSVHVIDLQTMESIGRINSDFYATMLLRDLSLYVWRGLAGLIFLGLMTFFTSEKQSLIAGTYFLALSLFLTYVGAYVLLGGKKKPL